MTRPPEPPDAPPVAGLLLAAGGGRRLGGRPKALLRHAGRPLVVHAVRGLHAGGCHSVAVVLGAGAAEVRRVAGGTGGGLDGCTVVDNPDWEQGMGSSLRTGLRALAAAAPGAGAALVVLVDQPGIGGAAVARLRAAYRSPGSLAAASYDGRRGHPVLLGAAHWPGVASAAEGDLGARDYLRSRAAKVVPVECGDVADPADIDTPQDLDRLR